MKQIISILFFSFWACSLFAQLPVGAKVLALGNTGTTQQDVNGLFYNQAGIAFANTIELSIATERRFSQEALSTYTAGAVIPTKSGSFGLTLNYFGFDLFNQQQVGIAYARKFAKNLSIGAQIDVHNYSIPQYGSRALVSFQAGVQYQLTSDFMVGAHIINPVRQEITELEPLPSQFKLGLAYTAAEKVDLYAELEQDLDHPLRFKSGIDYNIAKVLFIRLGIATNPTLFTFGLGIELDAGLKIDAAASYHQALGLSPGIGVRFKFQ